jgi:hypothetical protein
MIDLGETLAERARDMAEVGQAEPAMSRRRVGTATAVPAMWLTWNPI